MFGTAPTVPRGMDEGRNVAINLKIVSPSVSVTKPLHFQQLPASMTLKQLKAKIRDELPLKPRDEDQRLIHRGKALVRETDTLLDVFGLEAVQSEEQQTIHLVVRDLPDANVSAAFANSQPNPAVSNLTLHATNPSSMRAIPLPNAEMPISSSNETQPQAHTTSSVPAFPDSGAGTPQQQQQDLSNWLRSVQREARTRAIIQQNQRGRAQNGMRGIGDTASGLRSESLNSRTSPLAGYRADGRSGSIPRHPHTNEALNILQNAMSSSMQRSGSANSLSGRSLSQPGVTVPAAGYGGTRPGTGRNTPDFMARAALGNFYTSASTVQNGPQAANYQLYLLSSPEGPQALLLNNNTAETYRAHQLPQSFIHQHTQPAIPNGINYFPNILTTPNAAAAQPAPAVQQPLANVAPPQQANAVVPPLHGNPPAVDAGPMMAMMAPHVWSLLKLALFVWLVTRHDTSWQRWFGTMALAFVIFLYGTGALDGLGERLWRAIGGRLEAIFPRAVQQQPQHPAEPGTTNPPSPVPQPEELAARLLADRRNRQPWASAQLRRVERGATLFLASIAPGVAERHIARLEAVAREEERREREAAAVAAVAAVAAAAAAAAAAATEAEAEAENSEAEGGNQSEQVPAEREENTTAEAHEDRPNNEVVA